MRSLSTLAPSAMAALTAVPFLPAALAQDDSALESCLDAADVPYVNSYSAEWDDAILTWNQRVPVTPRAIAYATAAEHVQEAVLCAAEDGIKVAARAGGHSYGNYGMGGDDGHLVIQLDRMYGVTVNDDDTATIQAGSRLGHVSLELFAQGGRGIAHGTCPSVGIAGHALHGGYGFSSHTHGLTLDGLVGANVVLADGSLVHASETENSDLFWALRGAGSSFGIVTEFEFDTFAVPEQVTWLSVVSNVAADDRESAVAGLLSFQEVVEEVGLAEELNLRLGIGSSSTQALDVMYHGGADAAREALEALTEPLSLDWDSPQTLIEEGDWMGQAEYWAFGEELNITYPYEGRENTYTSSLTTTSISESAMAAFVDYWFDVGRAPDSPSWWLQMDVHGGIGSGIAAVSQDATAYVHRDKTWLFQFGGPVVGNSDPDASIEFINGFMDSLKDALDDGEWGRYANYLDSELDRQAAQQQYYEGHVQTLRDIKSEVDPGDLFYNPQSIDPAS